MLQLQITQPRQVDERGRDRAVQGIIRQEEDAQPGGVVSVADRGRDAPGELIAVEIRVPQAGQLPDGGRQDGASQACGNRFGRISGPFPSWRGPWTALNCSYRGR